MKTKAEKLRALERKKDKAFAISVIFVVILKWKKKNTSMSNMYNRFLWNYVTELSNKNLPHT